MMNGSARWLAVWRRRLPRMGLSQQWTLIPVAAVIGALAGLAAVGFERLVETSRGLGFGLLGVGRQQWWYLAIVLLLPAVGGLIVGCIQYFLQNFRGPTHGVPDVIESLARRGGKLRLRDGAYKAVTASVTIGSGGSAGVEGPIITIGSVVGSQVAQWLRLGRHHGATLLGCGASAATAAIFNAPIAAVVFVLEVMLRDFSVHTFVPIVVAAVFGAAVTQGLLGEQQALFNVPPEMHHYDFAFAELLPYIVLGLLAGLVGGAFIRLLPATERWWGEREKLPPWLRPALGGLVLGAMGVAFVLLTHDGAMPTRSAGYDAPLFFSNGYAVIEDLLDPKTYAPLEGVPVVSLGFLAALLVLKMAGTSITIGSGGSGGVIAPSLFMGATLGAMVGLVAAPIEWLGTTTPATYALAGMAGVIAATIHCPLAAVLLVFEITADYKVILPMMLVTVLATAVAQMTGRDSLYGAFLRAKGIAVGTYSDLTLLRRMSVRDIPLVPAVIVQDADPAQRLLELAEQFAVTDFVVADEAERYAGMIVGDDVRQTLLHREAVVLMIVGELVRRDLPTVQPDETLDAVLDKFARHEVASLAVVDGNEKVKGVITRSRLMRHYHQALAVKG